MRISDQEANRLRVLKAIRRAEPVARTELVALTGLTSQAISTVVADLLLRSLLLEERAPAAGRGRPRVLLRINPDGARALGAFLLPDERLAVEIVNLRGDRLFGRSVHLRASADLEALGGRIAFALQKSVEASGVPKASIHSIGLGVPGLVDRMEGVAHWLPRYPETPDPLAARIAARVGIPVFLESSGDMLTRAEHWFGDDRQVDDFALIFVGFGLGLGQYVDGLLWAGAHGMSSAFAHVKVTPGRGPRCLCGARGCLTTYATVSGVVGRIAEARGRPAPRFADMQDALQAFAQDARAGDRVAQEVFDFAGASLGVAAANHINVFDPARLLLLVQDATFSQMIEGPFRAALAESTHTALRGRVPVHIRASEEMAFAKGAAALVLERMYRGANSAQEGGPEGPM